MLTLLPALVVAMHAVPPPATPEVETPGERLTDVLTTADAIDWVAAPAPRTIAFGIERGDQALRVVARTRADGSIARFDVTAAGAAADGGALDWLADELRDGGAIARLGADGDGAIAIATTDGRHYLAIPGRGSGGPNAASRARWAAAWNG